jgi:uncharacterized membrane protein
MIASALTSLIPLQAIRMRPMKRLSLFFCATLLMQATAALAAPSYWRVVNVAADDTLNVRAAPNAGSADIGDLPPNAAGIEVTGTDASGNWGRIIWEDGNGWIATRFLAPDPQPMITGSGLPQGLLCGGTEPFWSVRFSRGGAVFSDIGGFTAAMNQTSAQTPQGRGAFPVALSHAGTMAASLSIIEPMACSDGMSDRDFPWRILFLISTADGQRFLSGCCQLPLEAGSN